MSSSINQTGSVSPQITRRRYAEIAEAGFPRDHLQPPRWRRRGPADLRGDRGRRQGRGLEARYLPVVAGKVQDEDAAPSARR
jgi:protein tyrosine phosphatase (PTP) superfamily phosphohydrolase (DUF442 family)